MESFLRRGSYADLSFPVRILPEEWYFEPPMVPATSQRMRGQLKKATDILDVPASNNMAHERTGWPTQKPLELLQLLINAFTKSSSRHDGRGGRACDHSELESVR
jgi:hypothetical protein